MTPDFIKQTAETIRQQLISLTEIPILMSWGIIPPLKAEIFKGMASLKLKVDARLFRGDVYICYDEASDYYIIYLKNSKEEKLICKDVEWAQLSSIIDEAIETGNDKDAYNAFLEEERKKLQKVLFN